MWGRDQDTVVRKNAEMPCSSPLNRCQAATLLDRLTVDFPCRNCRKNRLGQTRSHLPVSHLPAVASLQSARSSSGPHGPVILAVGRFCPSAGGTASLASQFLRRLQPGRTVFLRNFIRCNYKMTYRSFRGRVSLFGTRLAHRGFRLQKTQAQRSRRRLRSPLGLAEYRCGSFSLTHSSRHFV
jgi:hypothetical protein